MMYSSALTSVVSGLPRWRTRWCMLPVMARCLMLVISSGSRSGGSGSRNPVVLIVVISHLSGPASMSGDRTVSRPLPPVNSIITHWLERGTVRTALIYLETVPDGNL